MLSETPAGYFLYGLSMDENGQIFNAGLYYSEANIYIYELSEGNVLTQTRTIPKNDAEGVSQLFSPTGVCAVKDSVFVAQAGKNCISEFRIADGKLLRHHGESSQSNLGFSSPDDLAVHDDLMVIADRENNAVKMLRLPDLSFVGKIGKDLGERGAGLGEVTWPKGVDMNAEYIAVCDDAGTGTGKGRVQVFKRVVL
jgi:hypothetical protein